MNNIYGYIRVSTISQREDRQWAALEEFDIPRENVFVDKQSGKDFDRPAYNELMARLSESDTLVVKSLDRLGRSYDEMIQQLDIITREKGAAIVVIDMVQSGDGVLRHSGLSQSHDEFDPDFLAHGNVSFQ